MRVEAPDPFCVRATFGGLVEEAGPEGATLVERPMLPANPPRPFRSIVEVPDRPATTVMLAELAEMEKSTTVTITSAVRVNEPLIAFTVIV